MDETQSSLKKKHEEELSSNTKKHTEQGEDDVKKLKAGLLKQCNNEKLQIEDELEREFDRKNTMQYTSWKLKCQ